MKVACRDCFDEPFPNPSCKRCGGTGEIETDVAPVVDLVLTDSHQVNEITALAPVVDLVLTDSHQVNEITALKIRVAQLENMMALIVEAIGEGDEYRRFRCHIADTLSHDQYQAAKGAA